jgi:hypothetical protein
MHIRQLFIIGLCLITGSASSQRFLKIEQALGSKPVKIDYRQDSTIDRLLYEWDSSNVNKYKTLYTQLFQLYGVSTSEGSLDNVAIRDTWKPDDSTEIDLSIDPSYRIRLQIRNMVSQRQLNDKVLKAFLLELQNKNFTRARAYLSARISHTITDQQFESLRQNIRLDDSLLIDSAGTQAGLDHSTNVILRYRYKTDQDHPPKEWVRVMFDANNKILGIQPISNFSTNTNKN